MVAESPDPISDLPPNASLALEPKIESPASPPANSPPSAPAPNFHHISVLASETLEGLALKPGGLYLDTTLGGGGHAQLILDSHPDITLWGIDQDAAAITATTERLQAYGDRFRALHSNFATFKPGKQKFDGILADLGVSSVQLDQADRGFSFRQDAPLDMRMDPRQDLTAADIINHWDEKTLADLFFNYGEERLSRRIARNIVEKRPLHTTLQLADTIAHCVPGAYRHGRIHPATRVFQALRIGVNRELDVLDSLLKLAPTWLKPQGRLAIISFHSLEDRRVKYAFKESEILQIITKKPLIASDAEIKANSRSRSAKLRVAERIV